MRILYISPEAKKAIDRVIDYAADPQHWYRPDSASPGDNPQHCLQVMTYRCVFSFTENSGHLFRHLSVSVPAKNKLPHPAASFMLAAAFGFRGWDKDKPTEPGADWSIGPHQQEKCVVVAEEVPKREDQSGWDLKAAS